MDSDEFISVDELNNIYKLKSNVILSAKFHGSLLDDLGLESIFPPYYQNSDNPLRIFLKIKDKQKWFLAKIKYGF